MVHFTTLSQLLGVDGDVTLPRWARQGYLVSDGSGRYEVDSVNKLLATHAHGFETPPTLDDLRSGRVVLLRVAEIQERYGLSVDQLYSLRNSKDVQLAYIQLGKRGRVRYRRSDILRLTKPKAHRTLQEVGRIIGRSSTSVWRFIKSGRLAAIRDSETANLLYVKEEDLITFLKNLLPEWIDPRDWIDDCECTTEPLVPLHVAAGRLGLSVASAAREIKRRRALFINAGKRGTMVSPIWLAACEERAIPFTMYDVARLFDTRPRTVHRWKLTGRISCPATTHTHADEPYLFKPCWIAFLKANCSPGYEVHMTRFVTRQLDPGRNSINLIDVHKAAEILGCRYPEVEKLALSGELWGIRTPGTVWMFYKKRVKEMQKKLL